MEHSNSRPSCAEARHSTSISLKAWETSHGNQATRGGSRKLLADFSLTNTAVTFLVGNLIPAIGFAIGAVLLYMFYKLKDKDAELMAKCNAGFITREECEAQLSRKY